jgi:high-affinity iron transporter
VLFSFLIILREGFEIALILAIVLGYLKRTRNQQHFRSVWLGAGSAAVICVAAGVSLEVFSAELSATAKEGFEGFTMLFAVAVLTWMVFWMRRQAVTLGSELRHQVDIAIQGGSLTALVVLAFSSVMREGLETVLLLFAGASSSADSTSLFLLGAALGGVIAAFLGYLVYKGSHVLPMRQFFTATALVVIVLAAGMLTNGIAELQESGLIANLGMRPWDTDSFISTTTTFGKFLHTLLGYDSAPTWGQIFLYWSYLLLTLTAFVTGVGAPKLGRARQEARAPQTVTAKN